MAMGLRFGHRDQAGPSQDAGSLRTSLPLRQEADYSCKLFQKAVRSTRSAGFTEVLSSKA